MKYILKILLYFPTLLAVAFIYIGFLLTWLALGEPKSIEWLGSILFYTTIGIAALQIIAWLYNWIKRKDK